MALRSRRRFAQYGDRVCNAMMAPITAFEALAQDPNVREGVAFRQAIFDWCLRSARNCADGGAVEHALQWNMLAARVGCMDCAVLASAELEENILAFANCLAVPDLEARVGRPTRWVHVFSEAGPSAGHSAMAWRWMSLDPEPDRHDLVVLSHHAPVSQQLLAMVARRGGEVVRMDGRAPILARAAQLRSYAWERADVVVLHVHPWDVVATLAFGVPGGPPVLLVNHSGHLFGVGGSVTDRMINTRQSPQEDEWTARYRGMGERYVHVPLPLPPPSWRVRTPEMRAKARASLGLPKDASVLLTVGNAYKYSPLPGLDFLDFARSILRLRPDAYLLAVGVNEDQNWREARLATSGRLRAVGVQFDVTTYHAAADVYVEGFPFGSTTAVLEAGHHGLPSVLAPQLVPPPFGTDGRVCDEAGLEQPVDIKGYTDSILDLLDDPVERERRGQAFAAAVERHHSGAGWLAKLEAVKRHLPATHEVRRLRQPPPIPWAYVAFWGAFSNRVRADALGIVYRSAVQLGLAPRLDPPLRRAARTARHVRTLHPPLRLLITCTDEVVAAVPRNWSTIVYKAYDALAALLREDGRITRFVRSTRRLLGKGRLPARADV